ncbi:hypothetical protein RDV84_06425 [Lysobacter yananisis]|uniref:DUF4175 domain-containing protein n=1 Tax=Lysobacter yananisis TaxID=1003114 RepID=A0ABY9PBP6_9GAMM|nr:hypothetical protein [Lysobacter yananisis]WMT04461.1 hypothetical protein RDV84_06425 [Lysobacter yananisis]
MTALRTLRLFLTSLLALILAAMAFLALNWSGGELAARLRLPPGGAARLSWDLAWTVAAAALALWIVARWAPVAARWQAGAAWAALTALALWAVTNLGGEFPLWFDAGLLAALPALGWLAWRWSGPARRNERQQLPRQPSG